MRRWILHSIFRLTLLPLVVLAIETPVPERFLAPRDFNPHPITDVRRPSPTYKRLNIPGPAEIYSHYLQNREPAYKGQEYNQYAPEQLQQRLAQYNHHQDTAADHTLQNYDHVTDSSGHHQHHHQVTSHGDYHEETVADTSHHDDSYDEHIPKQYAFSYSVLDHHSGDDFSHAQQHNGHSTEGQYRVKLPDGRVQVVRYTADKGGYRAKVSYEPASAAEVQPTPNYYKSYPTPVENRFTPAASPTPVYHKATPTPIYHEATPTPVYHEATPTPVYHEATPTPVYHDIPPTISTYLTTPYPYTTNYDKHNPYNKHDTQYNHYNTVTEQPAYFQPNIAQPTYPSANQHFGRGPSTEPRVHVEYNGGSSIDPTLQPSQDLYEQHRVYKRDNR